MVVIRSHETSSSTPYHVFLSFRGEDTRYTFTDHLYRSLDQHGFRTFRDDDEMQKGECLKSELEKAIPQSKSSIIVISKNYASSTWCLDELVMILERRRTSRHVVLPVFYHVEPSEVRKQTGRTAEAFAKYEKQCEEETDLEGKRKWVEKIRGWRSALTEVADLNGHHLADGYESLFIDKIIKDIGVIVSHTPLPIDPYIIGIDSQVKEINMWLQDGSNDDRVRAICGMGGIGKTTIATIVYNQNFDSFDGSSFLPNIRQRSKQPNGLLLLQRELLSNISKREHGEIHNDLVGLAMIRDLVFPKRVLLVLDDVEKVDPIYDVLGRPDSLSRGSKVIITTRHERMLQPHHMVRVKQMGHDESIKLFSLKAFKEECPPESYTKHTKRALQICGGLPLALKVIGSSLSRKREDEWDHELSKLESIPPREILEKLKISYESLQDDHDKSLFLDIACFFVGNMNEDYVIKILEKRYSRVKDRIQNLITRYLLTINYDKVFEMHRLIQDMGREIIQEESCEAGDRSRLWHHQDAFDVLKKETGTEVVEGLTLDMRMLEEAGNHGKKCNYEEFRDKSKFTMYASQLKRCLINFITGQSVSTTITSQNEVSLITDAFKKMSKLRLLMLNYVQLDGRYDNFPKGIEWLSWHGFPLKSIPVEFTLKNLVVLDLSHSTLEQVWTKTPFIGSLKILDLSYSKCLARTPGFSCLPNLERLILKGCVSLVNVCESIGNLETLDLLDLQDCKTLKKLPRNIGKLRSLKTLIISGCNISEFPSEMGNMKSLEVLKADGNVMNPLHSINGVVKWWELIVWSMVATPRKGPETLWASLPCSLRELSLARCNLSDDSFPTNFINLPLLWYLDLSYNLFCKLPNCFNLTGDVSLYVRECPRLQLLDLRGLPRGYNSIQADGCKSLEIVMSPNREVKFFWLLKASELVELQDCFQKEDDRKTHYMVVRTSIASENIKGTLEYGVFNLQFGALDFLGREIPTFTGEKCEKSMVCFTVPTHRRIQCLNVWCKHKGVYKKSWLKIENKTKDLTWINHSTNKPDSGSRWTGWLSQWRFGNKLEAGDEIVITFHCNNNDFVVKECGYKIGYYDPEEEEEEEGEEEEEKGSTSTIEEPHHHLPTFRFNGGTMFGYTEWEEKVNELVELQDCFQKEDMTKTRNIVVRITNTSENIKGTLEYGVLDLNFNSDKGRDFPTFTGEKCEKSMVCFTVPTDHRRIQCLNVWCKHDEFWEYPWLKIENKTKDLTWIHRSPYRPPVYGCTWGWLSRWRFGNKLEAGDEIIITFHCNNKVFVVKECGYKIGYYDHPEEEEEEKGSTSTIEEPHYHLPTFRLSKGIDFLYDEFEFEKES